ncbi:DUF4255 domain-containing protein [Nocardia sp. XZ_19_231]|uniref:DUF4255 domain-containing protein n=1 Tax=Nocardia sp. XZ_19_231 TaxID=2769252 RepID=UPI00188FA5CD|nr:DUF4255 domain-containing protein [Nocardia sp. XZ_19_231]
MANTLALTAVTTALRNLLLAGVQNKDAGLGPFTVTTRTPDHARTNVTGSSLNLFLYRTVVDAAWFNGEPSPRVLAGEPQVPPLPLNLQYLITAFGPDDVDTNMLGHRVLAAAMSVLYNQPLFSVTDLSAVADSDLAAQAERIRITALPLSVDDISKLWSAFQSQYRISAAYQVGVVLIDSEPGRVPQPVLRRGAEDTGAVASVGAVPELREIRAPRRRPAALLGDELVVIAEALTIADTTLRFRSLTTTADGVPALATVALAPTAGARPGETLVTIQDVASDPDALGRWAPGHYAVLAAVSAPATSTVISNEIACDLAPTITVSPNSTSPGPVHVGDTLTLTSAPRILDTQRVRVLFGDKVIEPTARTNPVPVSPNFGTTPTTVTCAVPEMPPGRYLVRLRVDDVDSIPLADGDPPTFDVRQQVVIS